MYSSQQPPIYTTRHYIHDTQSNSRTNYDPSYGSPRPPAQPYPYYINNPQPTSVTHRPNYGQPSPSYVPPNINRHPATGYYNRSNNIVPAGGGGPIENTNVMPNENPSYNLVRSHEQMNTPPYTRTPITSSPKSAGGINKTLNLSDENPFHTIYSRYHYPSQIDPSKRITTQNSTIRSTDNKSLNLSDQNPFYSTYGRYYYPSQIDPQKRITEMPKARGPLMPTNQMSDENPFSNYRSSFQNYSGPNPGPNPYSTTNADWNRYDHPAPLSYRPIEVQRPPHNYYNQQQMSSVRPASPPLPQPPAHAQLRQPNSSGPPDKTSLNMSPDNPFADTYGQYYYPSSEEIKAQKRAQERSNRFVDRQPVNNNNANNNTNNRPVPPTNQMTEYPETERNEIISGKGNTKFARFDVNF